MLVKSKEKKTVFIKAPQEEELRSKLLEYLLDAVQSQYAKYSVKKDGILIQLVGDPVSIKRTLERLRKAREEFVDKEYQAMKPSGITMVNKSMIARHLGVPLGLESLKWMLDLLGIEYWVDDEYLLVREKPAKLRELSARLFRLTKAARELARGKTAEILAVVSLAFDTSIEEVYTKGLSIGVLREEDGKAVLAVNKEEALNTLIKSMREET